MPPPLPLSLTIHVQYTRIDSSRLRALTTRLTGSLVARGSKSSRKRKRILCLPEVKLIDVGEYKMLTTRHDSIGSSRLVATLVDSTQWKSIGTIVTTNYVGTNLIKAQKNKHQDRDMSKPKHDTRILCIPRSINVCKRMTCFKRFFTAEYYELLVL